MGFAAYHESYGLWRVLPGTGAVFAGTGMVWENLTCGLPVVNPMAVSS